MIIDELLWIEFFITKKALISSNHCHGNYVHLKKRSTICNTLSGKTEKKTSSSFITGVQIFSFFCCTARSIGFFVMNRNFFPSTFIKPIYPRFVRPSFFICLQGNTLTGIILHIINLSWNYMNTPHIPMFSLCSLYKIKILRTRKPHIFPAQTYTIFSFLNYSISQLEFFSDKK